MPYENIVCKQNFKIFHHHLYDFNDNAADLLLRSPPTMISLAGGLPNPELFPFKGIKVQLRLFLINLNVSSSEKGNLFSLISFNRVIGMGKNFQSKERL